MIKKFAPKRSGNDYSNLITVFAIIISVVYSSENYDVWDIYIGFITIIIGMAFIKDAKRLNDSWFSFFTASLLSLGVVVLISSIVFTITGIEEPSYKEDKNIASLYEVIRFIIFLVMSFSLKKLCIELK